MTNVVKKMPERQCVGCKEKKNKKVPTNKIFFALYEDQKGRADFLLLPFEERRGKMILPIIVGEKVSGDFESCCQHLILGF